MTGGGGGQGDGVSRVGINYCRFLDCHIYIFFFCLHVFLLSVNQVAKVVRVAKLVHIYLTR